MTNFSNIQNKLEQFIKKYYTNELIKGVILFTAFGLLYFIFTLFLEHFLWLQPSWRSLLFFVFVAVELLLLFRFIAIPLFKLFGLQKGISFEKASKIIGNHFPEVDDKLLNVLQLNQSEDKSELFLASVEQKSAQLQPIPFKSAINFTANKKYLKYLAIPLLIWAFTLLSGNNTIFKNSLTRVVNYQKEYEKPAPFHFKVLNKNLNSIEGKSFELLIETEGELIPENAQIFFNDESYFLKDVAQGKFSFNFENVRENTAFFLQSGDIRSRNYQLNVIKTPSVTGFQMVLNYPNYTQKRNETIQNSGNAIVPEGTQITWKINAQETDSVNFISESKENFKSVSKNDFSFSKQVRNHLNYQIATSNKNLKDYEQLSYAIEVIKDEHPKIVVKSDIDSVSRGPIQFAGQLSDDYGLSQLQLVYYDANDKENVKKHPIKVSKAAFQEFFYVFLPQGKLKLEAGKDYELYFQIFDNDAVNGRKSAKSQVFKFHNKTKQELSDDILREQKESLDNLDKNAKETEKLNKDFEEFTDKLKKKSDLDWNDKKEFQQFMKRQEQYQEMFDKQTDKLQQNLEELETDDEQLNEKKEELKKRIEETKELQKQEKLLDELQKLAEKLNKEGLIKKLDKLTQQKKQEKRSLERLLELTKRFYVEKKANDISKKLDSLSKKQEKLSDSEQNDSQKQEELNKEFDDIQKDFEEMRKQNEDLKRPMDLPDTKNDEKSVDEKMNDAKEELEKEENEQQQNQQENNKNNNSQQGAQKKQKSAAKKMKQMSEQMQESMSGMQGEMMQEDMETLRAILENLITFSLDQEELMLSLNGIDAAHASFPKKLKKQQLLKEHFEHIEDSLYVLSLRQQRISAEIQNDITEAHYNIDKSLENFAENRMGNGISNQQYTMTAANNLADLLSDMLNSMQNPNSGSGKGSGKSDIQLPDIIKKQQEMIDKMKGSMQKQEQEGKKQGQSGKSKEQMSGEQFQMYQEQQQLRQQLQEMMEKAGKEGNQGKEAAKKMKELEEQLLEKGFINEVLQQMLKLEHELLKLDDAKLKQGKDNKRESETNKETYQQRRLKELLQKKQFFNLNEILNREPLPLRSNYQKKVQEYFKETTND